jgi:hypothetical protein
MRSFIAGVNKSREMRWPGHILSSYGGEVWFRLERQKERDHSEDLNVDRTILKRILNRERMVSYGLHGRRTGEVVL